jgi:hypothetical protein
VEQTQGAVTYGKMSTAWNCCNGRLLGAGFLDVERKSSV